MTSRERVSTAMQGGEPDRVPVWCLLSLEHIVNFGTEDGNVPETIEALVEAECRLARRYRFDGTLVYLPGSRSGSQIGDFVRRSIGGVPQGDPTHVFDETDPSSWPQDVPQYESEDFYSSHLTREILGDDMHIGGWTADGFSRAIQWFPSISEAMMAMIDDPEKFETMVEYFDKHSTAWAAAQVILGGLESVQISSPYAGSNFISVDMYRRFVLPSVRRVADAVRLAGGFSYVHTCGFLSDRLELLADAGADGIECMDPPPLGDVLLDDAKSRIGHRMFLKGNIDSVNLLLHADDEQVRRVVVDTLRAGKPRGGYVLSTACSVAPRVSPGRVARLAEVVERDGWY